MCDPVTRKEFEELKAAIEPMKSLPARVAAVEQRVERNERHDRERSMVICNVPDNANDNDLNGYLRRLWKNGYFAIVCDRTYHQILFRFGMPDDFDPLIDILRRNRRGSCNSRYPPKVYVTFVRRQDMQQLWSRVSNLKGYKGANGRDIFVERDTTAEGKADRQLACFVRRAMLDKYISQNLPPPVIRVSSNGMIQVIYVLLLFTFASHSRHSDRALLLSKGARFSSRKQHRSKGYAFESRCRWSIIKQWCRWSIIKQWCRWSIIKQWCRWSIIKQWCRWSIIKQWCRL
jgi:hypothetical protein